MQTRMDSVMNTEPQRALNDTTIYSDIGLIVLGKIVEVAAKTTLDNYVDSVIFEPLE